MGIDVSTGTEVGVLGVDVAAVVGLETPWDNGVGAGTGVAVGGGVRVDFSTGAGVGTDVAAATRLETSLGNGVGAGSSEHPVSIAARRIAAITIMSFDISTYFGAR